MVNLKGLEPGDVWKYFDEIRRIPRLSKHEEKIRKYLLAFATENRLEAFEDNTGNILIIKPASPGYGNKKSVILQSHMDMVGEKEAGNPHNWDSDPVKIEVIDGWVRAKGTTLGADDGIGIAAQLAILSNPDLKTGRIEALFTVDEESGMTGAININPAFLSSSILLNLDSEDEGILYIGCAGGMDTLIDIKTRQVKVPEGSAGYEIKINGLRGGHSGDEIHKGYGNSIKIMTELLSRISAKFNVCINRFDGGNIRNAIPREAHAVIAIPEKLSGKLEQELKDFEINVKAMFGDLEPDFKITFSNINVPEKVMHHEDQQKLLEALAECPHGVIEWSKEMPNLVETSTNLASIKYSGDGDIRIVTTQRSSVDSSKHDIAARVKKSFERTGASVISTDGYPGWKPDLSSEILNITLKAYHKIFNTEASVKAIHAGLECGLFYEKNPALDMISFGPTIRGAHTPGEKIEIASVKKFWDLLLEVLRNIPEN
ncbi:MAG: aminoacyl-histidine dipeptidase [Bacteroidales bacterium]|nr:aminoacyl-histidine dipeptidase [Bacteroidales bacterium]